ncbi:MAG: erythromycin esterase family protein [Candidatus Eiseniibacteriota bacterium]
MRPARGRLRQSIIGLVLGALMTCGAAPPTSDRPPVEWLRKSARPFATCEPGGTDRDLASLRAIVGDARIVALGDVSGGTHEFLQMKRRIVEYLATHMGFTLFAIEANMPEAYRVNEYVLTGRGDSKAQIAGTRGWRNAREFLDFIEWMREFNRSGRGRTQFLGFDMRTPTDSAAAVVTRFVARAEPAYLDSVTRAYRLVATAPRPGTRSGGAPASFPASVAAGHKVRFSGWIRTENVHDGHAELWWRADAGARKAVVSESTREISGTTPWTPCDLTLDIPADATTIVFGCILEGGGTAWFDSLAVEIDGRPFAGTEDLDLTMERTDRPVGFGSSRVEGSSYAVDLDSTTALAGKRSLRIRRVAPDAPPPTATWLEAGAAAVRVLEHLEAGRSRFASSGAPADVDWAILNARTVAQMSDVNAGTRRREALMAENIARNLDQAPPGSKMVLWADNLRLARGVSLGAHLASRYGREMVVFGFAFHEGRYSPVLDTDRPGAIDAKPSAPGSLEWACHSTGIPRFILDLRRAASDPGASAWLAQPLPMRSFAFRAVPDTMPVGQYFDALIYFDHTTPSTPLR